MKNAKYTSTCLWASSVAMIVLLAPFALAKAKGRVSEAAPGSKAKPAAPMGFVLIEEDRYIDLQNLSTDLMSQSEVAFDQNNFRESADDLLAASRVYSLSAADGGSFDSRRQLRLSAARLARVAEEIRRGELGSPQQLRNELARAIYEKGDNDRRSLIKAWADRQVKRAGADMTASAGELEKALNWSGRMSEKSQESTLRGVRDVGAKLIKGANWTTGEVKKAIADLDIAFAKSQKDVSEERATSSGATTPAGEGMSEKKPTAPMGP